MIKDVIGQAISMITIFFLLVVTPIYYQGIVEWARSQTQLLAYTRDLIDDVIDTRELTEDTLSDYYADVASVNGYYTVNITRKVKNVSAKPGGVAGETYTTYIVVDDISQFDQGDRIKVDVRQLGFNNMQSVANLLMGYSMMSDNWSLCGRVR